MLLFILESYVYWLQLESALFKGNWFPIAFWVVFFLFSFVHIFLVLLDGWSRYQDYKRAKDLFFVHGVQHRIAKLFIRSKCQRMAALVAAEELGVSDELEAFYVRQGVKWYHYIPYFMIKDPLFIFKKHFWKRTFLEKHYTSKFDYHKLEKIAAL